MQQWHNDGIANWKLMALTFSSFCMSVDVEDVHSVVDVDAYGGGSAVACLVMEKFLVCRSLSPRLYVCVCLCDEQYCLTANHNPRISCLPYLECHPPGREWERERDFPPVQFQPETNVFCLFYCTSAERIHRNSANCTYTCPSRALSWRHISVLIKPNWYSDFRFKSATDCLVLLFSLKYGFSTFKLLSPKIVILIICMRLASNDHIGRKCVSLSSPSSSCSSSWFGWNHWCCGGGAICEAFTCSHFDYLNGRKQAYLPHMYCRCDTCNWINWVEIKCYNCTNSSVAYTVHSPNAFYRQHFLVPLKMHMELVFVCCLVTIKMVYSLAGLEHVLSTKLNFWQWARNGSTA